MINIGVTPESKNRLEVELKNKLDGIKELTSMKTKKELFDAVFSVSAPEFIKYTNFKARSLPNSFHHVYEWNSVGSESGRLFRLIKTNQVGPNGIIYYKFVNSKRRVPVPDILRNPGPTGKTVGASKIFKKKAEVMESGSPVSFVTKKTIAFSSNNRIVFVPPGKSITIKYPGGKGTTASFDKHFVSWWMIKPAEIAEKVGMFKNLENSVSKSLNITNAGKSAASNAISRSLSKYRLIGSVV